MTTRKPSSTIPMDRMVSIHEPGISIVDIPLVKATERTLKGYANIETSFDEDAGRDCRLASTRLAAGRSWNR